MTSDKIYIGNNKTLVGSYSANKLYNVYLRTWYSGSNIIIRNINASHEAKCNSDNYWEFCKGNNLWLDHITFQGHDINTSSNGGDIDKFIAIKADADYATISDCSFGKHEYGILIGHPVDDDNTLASYKGKPCVSMMTNYFNGCVTRGPGLFRYGYFHVANNYVKNFDLGYTMHTAATIYGEKNYFDGGTGKGSVVNDNALQLTNVSNASVKKVGPWYTDNGSLAVNCYENNNVKNISSLSTSWRPLSNYSYKVMDASKVPNYCMSNAGVKNSRNNMNYSSYSETGVPSAFYLKAGSNNNTSDNAAIDTSKKYMLKNVNSGLYMDVYGGREASGTNVQQWRADGSASNNTWRFIPDGNGYYYIVSQLANGSGYILDVANNSSANGANVQIYANTNSDAQKYKLRKNSDGSYTILTKASNGKSCVEVKDALKTSGANVQQWQVNGASCQNWTLIPIN